MLRVGRAGISEIILHQYTEALNRAADGGRLHLSEYVDVVELEFRVVVDVPIQAAGVLLEYAPLDAGIVEIEEGIPIRELPSTNPVESAGRPTRVIFHLDPVVSAEAFIVAAVFAGEDVTDFAVSAPEHRVADALARVRRKLPSRSLSCLAVGSTKPLRT
jgi:hypothetical protein